MNSFVGRSAELAELTEALAAERLVTLTGPAGIGKTEIARQLIAARGGGVFCDLTHARDTGGVVAAVAEALELPTGQTFASAGNLLLALAALGPTLLALDNFEQVLDAAPEIEKWLRAAPELTILVTSRERLRLQDERVFEVGPLELPPANAHGEECESVQMLVHCARKLRHGYRLRDADREIVGRIVRELDGIPLAIELAAPRLVFLGAATLLDRLEERFSLLRGTTETLHGAIEWSWNLLDEDERSALAQCSVFRGSFDLDAAESVLSLPGGAPAMDILQSLYEKSLLRAEAGDARFGLFLCIADFASDRLEDGGEAGARHARYYVELGEEIGRGLNGPDTVAMWDRLRTEKENLRAAAEHTDRALALRAAIALAPLMIAQGPYDDLERWIEAALPGAHEARHEIEARIHRAEVRRLAGRVEAARADIARALELSEGNAAMKARALRSAGTLAMVGGAFEQAQGHFRSALELHALAPDPREEALTLSALGAALAPMGRIEEARDAEERALELLNEAGAMREAGLVTAYLGVLFMDETRLDDALVCLAQAEAIHELLNDRFGSAFTTAQRGSAHHVRGQLGEAEALYAEAVQAFHRVGARRYEGAFRGYLALARAANGASIEETREALNATRELLREARDERFGALFSAYLGALEAKAGAIEHARALFEEAAQKVSSPRDAFLALAIELQRCHLLRAIAKEHGERGQNDLAAEREREVAAIIARARARAEDGRSPLEQNGDVLLSFRTLEDPARAVQPVQSHRDLMIVGNDARWFEPPTGARIELTHRQPLRLVLRALIDAHVARPNEAVSPEALVRAAWPGERILPRAAQNRLRVAIASLRKLGLKDVIVTRAGGYLLQPSLAIRRETP